MYFKSEMSIYTYFLIFGSAKAIICKKGNFFYDRLRKILPQDSKNHSTSR